MEKQVNFKFRKYNKRNWYTGVVHACKARWKEWVDVPEKFQDLHTPQQTFYKTLCGTEPNGSFNLTSKHDITCMRCLKILKREIDKEKLTQKTFHTWKSNDDEFAYYGKYKRKEKLK